MSAAAFAATRGDYELSDDAARLDIDAIHAFLSGAYWSVLPEHRGHGLATWLVGTALTHPDLMGLRRVLLATRDMHALYVGVGFAPLARPERFMEIHDPDVYQRPA